MRRINELIWHCSATRQGQHVTVEQIRAWHKARGWSDIGYHKVVYLDGSVHEGRSVTRIGAHVKGHNTGTLGYCYIGGVQRDGKTPADTRTNAQKVTMARLTREAITQYGVIDVVGHNEYAAKACPSFNVQLDASLQRAIKDATVGGTRITKPPKKVAHTHPKKKTAPKPKPAKKRSWWQRIFSGSPSTP